jgi:cation:H+ antiporter
MELLVLSAVAIASSLLFLYVGAKKTLHGAVEISKSLKVSKVVVGTVLVASITVLPELISSLIAVIWESAPLALGNILGSNIYNVPLIVGICGLVREFKMKNSVVEECGFMVGLSAFFAMFLILTSKVTLWMGLFFLAFYPLFIYRSVRKSNNNRDRNEHVSLGKAAACMLFGGLALLVGALLLVRSALLIVELFGLKEFYVGLTIVAFGSVVPESAVSLSAALAGEQEISVGNVIGDNIITITLVFGLVAVIRPFKVSLYEVLTTVPFMVLVTVMLLVMSRAHQKITRLLSIIMLLIAFVSFLVQTIII